MPSIDLSRQPVEWSETKKEDTVKSIATQSISKIHYYTAYGLNIHSCVTLPELITIPKTAADVVIKREKIPNNPLETKDTSHCFQATAEGIYVYWQGIGTFLIRGGREIIIDVPEELDEERLRLFILGAAIGTILHQRGLFVLHGSAVVIKEQAVTFIGDKRWGKSTMAAALHRRGHSLLGDDVIAVDLSKPENPLVLPAFPQLKLWPDAVASLGENPDNLPQLVAQTVKRNNLLQDGFTSTAIPLKQIYVLGLGEKIEIKPLEPQKILYYLLRNTYVNRFGDELLKRDRTTYFTKMTHLMKQVKIERLLRPQELSLLPKVAQLVEEQANNY